MTWCRFGLVLRSEDDSGPKLAAPRLTGKKYKGSTMKGSKIDKHTQEAINPNQL
jgi:hypothetical protein